MKQFIVLIAVLPLLMVFTMQPVFEQRNSYRIGQIQAIVYAAKEQAKQDGCFTDEKAAQMKKEIAFLMDISEEEIEFECDKTVKYRFADGEGRLIHYKIRVPISDVMAGASLFGLSRDENSYVYEIDSFTASEKLRE